MNTQQEYYYKVVRHSIVLGVINTWTSSNDHLPEMYTLKYELNKTTYPLTGKLFVFDTLDNARNFIDGCSPERYVILKVKATNPVTTGWMLYSSALELYIIHGFWQTNDFMNHARLLFNGTVLVDSVTPVEVIPPE